MPRLVTKLLGAHERVREVKGKCEGRKSYAEREPELVLAAKRLHRRSPKGHRRSLREIANELAAMGFKSKNGALYSASCIKSMVEGPLPAIHSRWPDLAGTCHCDGEVPNAESPG
jgi:hypothetical protein